MRNAGVSSRYGGNVRQNLQSRGASAGQTQARAAAPASRGTERMGSRQIAPSAPSGNRSAFSGVREGSAARTQSDHGYSSLGPARTSGGGGGHAGGGGGGSHGGGRR